MKTFKKALSIVLGLAMMLSCVAGMQISASAEGTSSFTVTVGDGSAKAGQIVEVPVTLSNVVGGYTALGFAIDYDPAVLTLAEKVAVTGNYDGTGDSTTSTFVFEQSENLTDDPYNLIWAYVDDEPNTADGIVATLKFTVNANATAGATTTVAIAANAKSGSMNGNEDVDVTYVAGTVTVASAECAHTYEGSKTYMDKDTYVWYKDCSLCGEPVVVDAVKNTTNLISHSLLFSDVVGDVIGINRASTGSSKGLTIQGYADYYFEVTYKRYGTGYVVENLVSEPFTSNMYISQNGSKTVDNFEFKSVSLTMMAEEFTVNLYLLDAEGDVVAVNSSTTSIQNRALAYAKKYSTDTLLLTALVDMVNYGATLQEYFAIKNPGTPIDGAALPTVGFEEYQEYATPVENLPAQFNNTEIKEKVVSSTGLLFGNTTLKIGATNTILTQIKTNGYDINNLEIYAYYTDYKNKLIEDRVAVSELGDPTTQGSAILYSYVFGKLKLAELETPVTFEIYNNGTLEYRYTYSIGKYANTYIKVADTKAVVEAMECFGMSARDKLYGVDA